MRKRILAVAALVALAVPLSAGAVSADPTPNIIIGTRGSDILIGTKHNDAIFGRDGRDFLSGRRGNDILRGGPGNDVLRAHTPLGHSGTDLVGGGLGDNDVCYGDSSDVFRGCETVIIRN